VAAPADTAPAEHVYRGALVLEADPSVRAMVASELKATGRAVFACADSCSARTFLEATPDRFEILIVDHPQRLAGADALAATIRTVAPALKIFVLAPYTPAAGEAWPRVHHIRKPFGVHELRHALASVLAAG
jgi:CheY-like chemotaxis protein